MLRNLQLLHEKGIARLEQSNVILKVHTLVNLILILYISQLTHLSPHRARITWPHEALGECHMQCL